MGLTFIESHGVFDPESSTIPGRTFTANALRNLVTQDSSDSKPDLTIYHSSSAVPEYDNPSLLPGMFPTLFPYGLGGFEDKYRATPISFRKQAEYFLDLGDKRFRYHRSYMFVVWNMIQRRTAHLHTHLTVHRSRFNQVADTLNSLTADTIARVAHRLENEVSRSLLTSEEKAVYTLLEKVNAVASKSPGSEAHKLSMRGDIRSGFFPTFGIPHLFLTVNPSAAHSPIFQAIYGDYQVDLSKRVPNLVPSTERAKRLAEDPVAAADFYDQSIHNLFEHLFGWDFEARCSKKGGLILGELHAFYGTNELTGRANFHGHFIIYLEKNLNPKEIHRRLRESFEFQERFLSFTESIIHHHLPNIEMTVPPDYNPRVERPLCPPETLDDEAWQNAFLSDLKQCGESLQRHQCRAVCHKYGNDNNCRFGFPHNIEPKSYFDRDSNSIILKCLDPEVNNYNPYILTSARHNHDLQPIFSGKAATGAAFYITDYITKMDANTYQQMTLLSKAVSSIPSSSIITTGANSCGSISSLLVL